MPTRSVVTIPRSDHTISRAVLSPNAVRVLYRLHDHGFISHLVGGCVRDLLLGREPKDFDIVTNATPGQIKRLFRNCRLIGRRFRLAHLHFQDEIIEVATFRSSQPGETEESEPDQDENRHQQDESRTSPRHLKDVAGMVLRDNVFGSPEEDTHRRDFTINALFYNIADFSIIDHVGGMYDLQHGIIRIIGDARQRYTEDPVRMMRAIRFAALLGFTVEGETWQAILELGETITRAAPARLYEEILKLLLCGEGAKIWQMLRQTGLLRALFPQFDQWLETEYAGFPHTGPIQALVWVDARVQEGGAVSPPLLFALLFSQYLDEKGERHRSHGLPYQQSIDAAIAELFGELAPTVLIPNRVGGAIRGILSMQRRFQKTPGKQAASFVARPGFTDALQFLRFREETADRSGSALYAWWSNFAADLPAMPPPPPVTGEASGRKRRRKRRRHRRPQGTP